MGLKDALGFAVDYGKFIVTLWAAYIALITGIIGWLVTLRGKAGLELPGRIALLAAYGLISLIFGFVLVRNHAQLVQFMALVHGYAQADPVAKTVYGPKVDAEFVNELGKTVSVGLPIIVFIVGAVIWFISGPPAGTKQDSGTA